MSQPNRNIYTAYRGDTYLGEGTIDEIAVLAGVKHRPVVHTPHGRKAHRGAGACMARRQAKNAKQRIVDPHQGRR